METGMDMSVCDRIRMAEFEAIVTASFDHIGSQVVTLDNIDIDSGPPTPLLPDRSARRSAFSFLRKVKSHATSLFLSTTRQVPPPSFVPALPTPAPTRAPDVPKRSFFDDDIDNLHRPVFRRIASASAARPSSSCLDSAFTSAPVLFDFPSYPASTSSSVAEHHGILGPDSRTRPARV